VFQDRAGDITDPARLAAHGFLAFPRPRNRGAAPPRGIPLAGAIAAGHPFESYSDAYAPDEFFPDDKFRDAEYSPTAAPSSSTASAGGPTLEIDPKVFCDSGDVLALKVEGDSMVDAGILDGDYAIIRRQNTVEEGEIAAVIINGEGTLKRWRCNLQGRFGLDPNRKTSISLLPENDNFDPIEITEDEGKDVLVIGKYVGLIRGIQPLL
jgi:SOS-response transcriptional repressor LexA